MDPLDFFESDELLRFFHCRKTELSCMENPQVFLCQLRDYNLIPEDRYKKVIRMKSKENMKRTVYEILDWIETKRPDQILTFWKCVFKDIIKNQYPPLRLLYNSLMDGSYREDTRFPERVENEETCKKKRKDLSEDEDGVNSLKKKKKQNRSSSVSDDDDDVEEQPGPSSQDTPGRRKKLIKISFSSPLKKGEKKDIWTWPLYKYQLPVTCGNLKGTLHKSRLAKGEKCILFQKQWFTPGGFEKHAGKESSRNWKFSIRCNNTPLAKLIQEGHLKVAPYKGGAKKTKKSLFPSDPANIVSEGEENENEEGEDEEDQVSSNNKESSIDDTDEEEEEEEAEQQPEDDDNRSNTVFKVTCGAASGTLHKRRFASGTCGKSIRTERSWMSPVDFAKEALCKTDVSWRKDIKWEGKPLSVLIDEGNLKIHSLLCSCGKCKPDKKDLENQKNDDECCVCKRDEDDENGEDAELVVCDNCPRSFHQRCHLPHVEDAILRDNREWMCTFCVFRSYTYIVQLGMQEALSHQISGHMLQCQYLLLLLHCADEEQTFASDPNRYLSDYSIVIQRPMWLDKVANKLQTRGYKTVGEFVSDVQLIFTNCAKYNRDNPVLLAEGHRLKELFDREFKSVFNIRE